MARTASPKVLTLLAEGGVKPDPQPCESFTVRGDHGTYRVVVGADIALCTCPSKARCSHVEAAATWVNASPAERELMVEALEHRAARDAAAADEIFALLAA